MKKENKYTTSITLKKVNVDKISKNGLALSKAIMNIIEECNIVDVNRKLLLVKRNITIPHNLKSKVNDINNLSRVVDDGLSVLCDSIKEKKKESYNGYSNWETWNVNLLLTNDYEIYNEVLELVSQYRNDLYGLHKALAEYWDSLIYKGIIKESISKHRIEWKEVCESIIEE